MRRRRYQYAAVVTLLAALSTAGSCPKTTRTPEGFVADYGVKIGKTVKAAQDAVGAVGTAPDAATPVREGALAALKGLNVVNEKGIRLGQILDQMAAARKAGQVVVPTSIDEALRLLAEIDDEIILRIVPQLGANPVTAASLKAVSEISKLVLTVQFELGKGSV